MTWKGMIAHYLGWAAPIENNYELSVSGAPFLLHATFRERIALEGDIRLFLWETSHKRPVGFLARAGFRMRDHQRFARIAGLPFEIWDVSGRQHWPSPAPGNSRVRPGADYVDVAVLEGGRKLPTDGDNYIIAKAGTPYEQFRTMLTEAPIVTT